MQKKAENNISKNACKKSRVIYKIFRNYLENYLEYNRGNNICLWKSAHVKIEQERLELQKLFGVGSLTIVIGYDSYDMTPTTHIQWFIE